MILKLQINDVNMYLLRRIHQDIRITRSVNSLSKQAIQVESSSMETTEISSSSVESMTSN